VELNENVQGASDRVVTRSSLPLVARVQLPNVALSSLTQATILSGSVKYVATGKQWVTAVEDCGCKLSHAGLRGSGLVGMKHVGGG